MNRYDLELRSSAVTLSDMEIFVFPQLLYALVLANILSPRLWEWRNDPWFKDIDGMSYMKKIHRLKQYIMDKYIFNLDLDTWGLTSKETELKRFEGMIDTDILRRSNALFGYEGDRYYFDIDIRRHFGLDKYNDNSIPYWKTETIEAMDAFSYKQGYNTGAGECVSLSTLYAAALFVVARIPLENIFLMATPLHSQDFIIGSSDLLTNNRRIVTKNMWFNGTALSMKARRALENEQVTIVSHISGYIHSVFPEATIDPENYKYFSERLVKFLKTHLDKKILGNFLRCRKDIHKCLQVRWNICGNPKYIGMEKLVEYEMNYPYMFTDDTREKLMNNIDISEFHNSRIPSKILLNDLEDYITKNKIDFSDPADVSNLERRFAQDCLSADILIKDLIDFCNTEAKLPDINSKVHVGETMLKINNEMSREDILKNVINSSEKDITSELALYSYRDISLTGIKPFLYAALYRNPVSISALKGLSADEILKTLQSFADRSIYDGKSRLAQPDEVWNFRTGDGVEKAILMANILKDRFSTISLEISGENISLQLDKNKYSIQTSKKISKAKWQLFPELKIS